jgi:TonB-dependent receptor
MRMLGKVEKIKELERILIKENKMRRCFFIASLVLSIVLFMDTKILLASSSISGSVKDAGTGEPLFGASIVLVGTSIGAATDMDGEYKLQNVKPGNYVIHVSYIGYQAQDYEVTIKDGVNAKHDFKLEAVGIEGKTVVVTAQASGQKQAINQQLTSDQIVNVVSATKIQELPDANAAESVGRLPGVSVLRSGGEGNKIVIRGLSPKYNEVMIDGIKMSSSDADNRSNDLSMISSNMLEGIQVSKTVTADMDAEAIGGIVNFELREAKESEDGKPVIGLQAQGGYNDLSNATNKMNNYKYIGSIEKRFFDNKLGVFAQVDIERRNLSSNEMGATYGPYADSQTDYITTNVNLYDIFRDRQRYNGALVMDYKLPAGKIKFTNFFSSGSTITQNRQETYTLTSNTRDYWFSHSKNKMNIITNGLSLQQELPIFHLDARLSHSYSESKSPDDLNVDFTQTSAGLSAFINKTSVNPVSIVNSANQDLSKTYLNTVTTSSNFSRERALTGSVDLKTTLNVSDLVSAEIKFGGKYRYQTRSYDYDEYNGGSLNGGSGVFVDALINSHFGFPSGTFIPITYFIDPNYDYGEFLGGDYKMTAPLNGGMMLSMANLLKSNVQNIIDNTAQVSYAHDNESSTNYDYSGHEHQSAFYVMSVINIGQQITFIPGVRYQALETTYKGVRGIQPVEPYDDYNHYDTTVTKNHNYWLPDISLKYKPLSWLDVRLSYSNTLAYPDFNAIIPRISMAQSSISWVNYNLVPSHSTNYDAYVSVYDNTIGLFTVGGFLKRIKDLIYSWTFYASGDQVTPYLPHSIVSSAGKNNYAIYTYVNNSYTIDNYGMELDWQTHFWYLPEPFSGLVFSANYTHIFSKAQYPYVYTKTTGRSISYIDTSFTDRLLYQPDDIVNLSLGFDYKDFSIRLSMLYQTDIFTGPNFRWALRSHTSAYTRWDISAKQELPWFGIQVYGDINNINGAKDVSVIQGGGVPTSEEDYGLTADLGIRLKL